MENPNKELLAVSHINCFGVDRPAGEIHRWESRDRIISVSALVRSFRSGCTEVFCPSMRGNGICGVATNAQRKLKCPYFSANEGNA